MVGTRYGSFIVTTTRLSLVLIQQDTVLIVIARKFLYLNFQRRLFQQYSCPLEIFLQVSPDKNGIAVNSNVFIKFNRLKSEMALTVP